MPRQRSWRVLCLAIGALLATSAGSGAFCPLRARSARPGKTQGGRARLSHGSRRVAASDVEQGSPGEVLEADAEQGSPGESVVAEPKPVATWPITALAGLGVLDCSYLTYSKLSQIPLACPASGGCSKVLESPWSMVGPVPLAAIGLLAYGLLAALSLQPEPRRGLLLYFSALLATASAGLMAVLIFVIQAPCQYCAASAFISAALLALSEVGQARSKGNASRRSVLGASAVLALGALRGGTIPAAAEDEDPYYMLVEKYAPEHPPVRSSSSQAEKALARHLTKIGAACYSTFWCPHCQEQREAFGKEGADLAPFVECSTPQRRQNDLCREKDIEGYPSWIIDGKTYRGGRKLAELAEISGFKDYPAESFIPRDAKVTEYIWGPSEPSEPNEPSE
eukprot:TRINITY_DN2990_c0_g2_i1.p1 TRINITY_DN2990_c0_g2~~TRINITY_DN2990_c0_g2_i1.p1  ORF type:complete len:412 (+),score=75.85 TRINITY_DN2990_c0_g2_i1:54-1238(+)